MKLAVHKKNRSGRQQTCSGQIMAEACVGLALLVFVWLIMSFVTYMTNNRIRTAMAARDAAWLSANGGNPASSSSSFAQDFFYGNDVKLARVQPPQQSTPALPFLVLLAVDLPAPTSFSTHDNTLWNDTVTFGMTTEEFTDTTQFPFVLLKMHVPFMPDLVTGGLQGFLSVTSNCAWPGYTDITWNGKRDMVTKLLPGSITTLPDTAPYSLIYFTF